MQSALASLKTANIKHCETSAVLVEAVFWGVNVGLGLRDCAETTAPSHAFCTHPVMCVRFMLLMVHSPLLII